MTITLPAEIALSDKRPRTAIAIDYKSGVKQVPDTAREVLIIGQQTSDATVAANTPTRLYAEDDGADLAGPGSVVDRCCRAAFKANPLCKLSYVGVEDAAGTPASSTITFATTATANGSFSCRVNGQAVSIDIAKSDTATEIGDALEAAINGAVPAMPVTADNAAGVVTFTARNDGTVGNGIRIYGEFAFDIGTTATFSSHVMGSGATDPSLTAALAAIAGHRYHLIVPAFAADTQLEAVRDHAEDEGSAENGLGEIVVCAFDAALSTSTTMAGNLNSRRHVVCAINGAEAWFPEIAAAAAALMATNEIATVPYNGMVLKGIKAPPIESRWTKTERRTALDNGVTPLIVLPGEKVAFERVITTYTTNDAGDPDYSTLDVTVIQGLDYFRDALKLMFNTNYAQSRWADSDPDGLLPPDVATPDKVKLDLINVARDMERLGICQNVEGLKDQFVVEKVGTHCHFSVPADIVDGMHEKLGKVVLIRVPFAA